MTAEAWIVIPVAVKQKGGRVGVIFGNYGNGMRGDRDINFEVYSSGQLRLYWNNGGVQLYGSKDLRDGVNHVVRFERTRSATKIFVDGQLEKTGSAGSDVPKRKVGSFIGNDWREGGMAFRGDIVQLKINNILQIDHGLGTITI